MKKICCGCDCFLSSLLLLKIICWVCWFKSVEFVVVVVVVGTCSTTDWRFVGKRFVVSVQFFSPADVMIGSFFLIVAVDNSADWDGGDDVWLRCCVWAFWKRWLTIAFESDDAPDANAERRKFVVDGSLKSIINGWDDSTTDDDDSVEYSSAFVVAVVVVDGVGAIIFGAVLVTINDVWLVVPMREITSIWFGVIEQGFWAADGERTKSGFNAFTFNVTGLPVVDTIDDADSRRTRLAGLGLLLLLLLFESRFGDRRTFCTPERTANVDSFVVFLTCSNSDGTRAITFVSVVDDGVRTLSLR